MKGNKLLTTKNVVLMGMFGALAGVLMLFEIPLLFIAPPIYKLDFSEVPILVGTFALGPVAGVVMELLKIMIRLVLKPTSTAFVGEFANFVIGCALVVPAGIIYRLKKTRKGAMIGMVTGTVIMTVMGVVVNAQVMLPFFSKFYGMPLETIIGMGTAVNPLVYNIWTFVLICVGPFNLLKGVVASLVTSLVYKRISDQIHSIERRDKSTRKESKNANV